MNNKNTLQHLTDNETKSWVTNTSPNELKYQLAYWGVDTSDFIEQLADANGWERVYTYTFSLDDVCYEANGSMYYGNVVISCVS